MVHYYYATKTDNKYKNTFPKTKKKAVQKAYRPMAMPEFREMFDHLMNTCGRFISFRFFSITRFNQLFRQTCEIVWKFC